MSNARHDTILRLIQEQEVSTQEMLRDLLEAEGFSVTQATVSRDIRQLGLRKKRRAGGTSCYVNAPQTPAAPSSLLSSMVVRLDYAQNTVVVCCHAGSAQAACAVIDRLQFPDIVGTIAGDDTIFILTRSEERAKVLLHQLESRIWG